MPISIGLPFYNCERFLPDAIRSVFAQTYEDWELILIDDGSTDRSLEIARSIKDERVRVFSDGKNLRQPARRNQANKEARHDLIAIMDADDIMFPTRLEEQHKLFDDPEVKMVSAGACIIDDRNSLIGLRHVHGKNDLSPKGVLHLRYNIINPNVVARKSWFLDTPYDESLSRGEDYEFFLKKAVQGSLSNQCARIISKPLLFYREDGGITPAKLKRERIALMKIAGEYAPKIENRFGRIKCYSRLHLRSFCFACASLVGLQGKLKQMRNDKISDHKLLQQLNESLKTVLETKVPGLDFPSTLHPIKPETASLEK